MSSRVTIKQFTDEMTGSFVAPFTPEHAIYDTEGKRLDVKIAGLDLDRISDSLDHAEKVISDQTDESVQKIIDEQAEDRARLTVLEDFAYPMKPTFSVGKTNNDITANTISYNVTVENKTTGAAEPFAPEKHNFTKRVYVTATGTYTDTTIVKNGGASGSFNSNIESGKEYFYYNVTSPNRRTRSASTISRFVCFYAHNMKASITSSDLASFTKVQSSSKSFNPTITTALGEYIWLGVPKCDAINKVTSGGFDFALTSAPTEVSTPYGTYLFYRSEKELGATTWSLVIS